MGKYIALFLFSLSIILAMIISLVLFVTKEDNVWKNKELSSLATTSVQLLPREVQEWHERGKYVEINGFNMFYILLNVRNDDLETKQNTDNKFKDTGDTTLILIHGFPTSSFDYHRALDKYLVPQLKKNTDVDSILMFDHVGFGFSDKPLENYTYSLIDQAENAVALWKKLGVKRAHLVSHDMGDSVLTEVIALKEKNMLSGHLDKDFFASVTFTNGGMHYAQIGFRLTQRLLMYPSIGNVIQKFRNIMESSGYVSKESLGRLSRKPLTEIWGPMYTDTMEEDINHILQLIEFNGGNLITDKTMSYLMDRARFETRWFAALRKFRVPIQLYWGDSDAVSPLRIPLYLRDNVLPKDATSYKTLQNVGHFLMLERPDKWSETVVAFINSNLTH